MDDFEVWKVILSSFNIGGRFQKRCEQYCKNHGVEFNKEIYDILVNFINYSKESSNFIFSKVYKAKDDTLNEKDIDEILSYEFDSLYQINSKYNDSALSMIFIYNIFNNLPTDKKTFEKLGLDTSSYNKISEDNSDIVERGVNNIERIDKWFNNHKEYTFERWFITDESLTPKDKDDIAFNLYDNDLFELIKLMGSKSVEIEIAKAPVPNYSDEWIAYDNNDLKKLTEKAMREYFYDYPILLESVRFLPNGGKGNTLGQCSHLGKKANFCLNSEMANNDLVSYILLLPQLKGFDCKEVLLHEMTHSVDCSLHGLYGSPDDAETKGHGKGFMEIAEVINHRADVNIGINSSTFEGDIFSLATEVYNYIKRKQSYIQTFFHSPYFFSKGDDLEKLNSMWMCSAYDCDKSENHILYNLFYTFWFVKPDEYKYSDIETYLKENGMKELVYI